MNSTQFGDWLEAHTSISKKGRTLLYASGTILKDEVKVLRSNAIYSIVAP